MHGHFIQSVKYESSWIQSHRHGGAFIGAVQELEWNEMAVAIRVSDKALIIDAEG
jgi:hypothetical protein